MAGQAIRISILANGAQARREVQGFGSALKKTLGIAGGIAGAAGIAGMTAGLVNFAKRSVEVEGAFSQTMASVKVNAGIGQKALGSLSDLAVQLGADTVYSANEAAQAMLELSKGGMTAAEIKAGALKQTLSLAATEGIDLGESATIVARTLKTFGLNARDAGKAVDMLAAGSLASTASVEGIASGLKYVGSTAHSMRIGMADVVTGLAALNDAGIDASTAGTSLNRFLLGLTLNSKQASETAKDLGLSFTDVKGDMLPMTEIVKRLRQEFGDMSTAQRSVDLKKIFGVEGMRAANILIDKGVKGWKSYSDEVTKTGVAQKMADARMKGTKGALERLSGSVETAQLALGKALAPSVQKAADYLADNLGPAMDDTIDGGRALVRAVEPAVDVLKLLGSAAKDVAGFVVGLPGPIKEIGIQAGLAALALPRMASAASIVGGSMTTMSAKVKQTYAEMTYATTRAQKLQVAATNMGGAVRAAAGVGGMVALAQGAQESDLKMKTLLNTLGGAATGLAVGGPVGAAVGGLGGLMLTLSTHTDKAKKSFADSIQPAKDYAGTLDQVTGAATAATKAMVLNDLSKGDAISSAKELGISSRDLVNAILGEEPALKRVNAAMAAGAKGNQTYIDTATGAVMTYGQHAKALGDLNEVLGVLPSRYREATAEQRRQIRVTQDFSSLVGKVPKRVVTKLEQTGVAPTLKGIAKVAAKYNLVPKQIKALISAVGVNATVKDVQKVKKNLESTGKTKPNFDPAKRAFDELFRTSTASATKTGVGVAKNLKSSTAKARPNLDPFRSALRTGTNQAQTQASSGGHQVGSALGSGTYAGIGSWIQPVVSRAVQMVRQAIAAAKAEAKSHSPSKKTEQLGMDMGKGLAIGLKRSEPSAKKGGKSLAQQVLAGVTEGTKGVESAWDKVVAAIKKRITGKKQEQREKAAIKRLRDEHKALIKNAKAQDKVSKKLDEARDKLKDLIQQSKDYAASIKDSVVATGDVTTLGRSDDGTVSIRNLIDELKNKVNNAKRFAELIRQLTASGLNQTALQQMLAAGPEAALATAEAISQGGAAAIAEINDLQAQLAATGTKLGDSMADTFYANGIKAAQGLVDGLLAEQKKLDRVAKKLAKALLEAVKKQLGIKSPSRAFRDIGSNVVEGLTIGLDDTYVKRQGTTLATSLVKGFGTPALDAYAQVSADSRQQITITLTAEQLSALERGRRIQADLDAYRGTGGRRRA